MHLFRHEKPSDPDDPLSHQNMRDRYYGNNDPVAEKLLNRAKVMPILHPPEDESVTTLYVGDIGPPGTITEADLRYSLCLLVYFLFYFCRKIAGIIFINLVKLEA